MPRSRFSLCRQQQATSQLTGCSCDTTDCQIRRRRPRCSCDLTKPLELNLEHHLIVAMALGPTQPLTEMSTRNISWGGKRGWCVRLTTLRPSCANCLEMWEPQPPGTLRACPGLQWDSFTFTSLSCHATKYDLAFRMGSRGPSQTKRYSSLGFRCRGVTPTL
jgi:hypothetical protein